MNTVGSLSEGSPGILLKKNPSFKICFEILNGKFCLSVSAELTIHAFVETVTSQFIYRETDKYSKVHKFKMAWKIIEVTVIKEAHFKL